MAQAWAKSFYNSKAWLSCRAAYIGKRRMIDGGFCEHCHEALGYIVDHIEELTEQNIRDANIALNHDNLQYLCTPCHNVKTLCKGKAVLFDADGQPLPP